MITLLALSSALAQTPAIADVTLVATPPIENASQQESPDRSAPPAVKAASPWELPSWVAHTLHNGVTVYHVRVPGVRKVELTTLRHRGALAIDTGSTYAAWATGWLQDAASKSHQAEALEIAYDALDAAAWSGGPQLTEMLSGFNVPAESFDAALALYASTLVHPAYPKSEIKRYARETTLNIEQLAPSNPSQVASYALNYAWNSPDSPYGFRSDLSELKRLKSRKLKKNNITLNEGLISVLVVGDRSWESLVAPLTEAFAPIGHDTDAKQPPDFDAPTESQYIAVHVAGAKQAVVRLRMAAPPQNHADADAFKLLNWAYGGAFLSRLNRNIREERGWTYGARSSYSPGKVRGTFDVGFDTKASLAADAIEQTQLELDRLVEGGLRAAEIQSAWAESVASWNQTLGDASSAEARYRRLLRSEKTPSSARTQLIKQGTLSPDDARPVGERWLSAKQTQLWIVVGDKALLEDELATSGHDWRWISAKEAVQGTF